MRVRITVAAVILAGGIALFFLSGSGNSKEVFYYSPSEFRADASIQGDRVRLKGKIAPGSVKASADKMEIWFDLGDGKETLKVHYKGAVPEAFREGLEAVVDGRLGPSGTFEGRELIVKCPSKYESSSPGPGAAGPKAP